MKKHLSLSFLKKTLSHSLLILSLGACGGGSSSGTIEPPANTAPVAVAGIEQLVDEETKVTLFGAATDADGTIVSYNWSETSGKGVVLSDSSSISPTFLAPATTTTLTLSFQLTVTDNEGATNSDTVNIIVNPINTLPVSNAGESLTVLINNQVILDGSKSSDPDGTALIFNWYFVSTPVNSSAILNNNTLESPSFTVDILGEYVLELIVNDGEADSAIDRVIVTAITPNNVPVADAGVDQVIILGNDAPLDGGNSSDTDNQALSYNWSLISKPINSNADIEEPSIESPLFKPDIVGDYVLALVVNDGKDDSLKDEVTITVGTGIGGIISVNTILNAENSPYILTKKLQTAYGITLQINSGVKIIGNNNSIEVFGSLDINGSEEKKVVLESVNIVPGDGDSFDWFDINIDHVIAESGSIYSPTGNAIHGSLSLRNSVISNMRYISLWYPVEDSVIEKNIFINSGGISTGHRGDVKIYIRNNVFYKSQGSGVYKFSVDNWAAYDNSRTIVEFNSFLSVDRIAVQVRVDGLMTAENNYWNTLDTSVIESMINDNNDDLSSPDDISYDFFLTEPHVNTPDPTPYLPQ